MTAAHSPTLAAINHHRFHVQFYTITPGGKKPMRTAVMTLAEIEDITARSNWRAKVGECVG